MKLYAVIDGVCGIREGYSNTEANWFKSLDEAMAYKNQMLKDFISDYERVDSVESSTDGMRDIIVWDKAESEESVFQIVEVEPQLDAVNGANEYVIWNQLDCNAVKSNALPTDQGVLIDALRNMQNEVFEKFNLAMFHEFVYDLQSDGSAMLDADDLVLHYFRVPKSKEIQS